MNIEISTLPQFYDIKNSDEIDGHRCEDYVGAKVHEMYDFLVENEFLVVDNKYLER